jgi:hypothetical protein
MWRKDYFWQITAQLEAKNVWLPLQQLVPFSLPRRGRDSIFQQGWSIQANPVESIRCGLPPVAKVSNEEVGLWIDHLVVMVSVVDEKKRLGKSVECRKT